MLKSRALFDLEPFEMLDDCEGMVGDSAAGLIPHKRLFMFKIR